MLWSGRRLFYKKSCWISCAIVTLLLVYGIRDSYGPDKIQLQGDNAWGLPCLRAKDLVVQCYYDSEGGLWATREMTAYLKKSCWISSAIVALLVVYGIKDYYGPGEIRLQGDNAWGLPCMRARDLLVQCYDLEGGLWATRGMIAYRLLEGESKFVRQCHIPTGCSIFWLRNFSIVRRLLLRPECVELLVMPDGEICAMSAGAMWYRNAHGENFEKTLILRHYAIGIGQGIFHPGLARLINGTILFGEYFTNRDRTNVRLYASNDNGRSWQVAHEFPPGRIRHVHAVQQDPYTKNAWVLTGDADSESMVAETSDCGKSLNPIGEGSQTWRVCQLAFTKEALFWGADTGNGAHSGIYKWDRKTHELTKLTYIPGAVFYAIKLSSGMIVLSTDCEGAPNERDDKTRLWIITDGKNITEIPCGSWASRKRFAKLWFPRDQGSTSLCLTCLNQKEFNDGDLIILSEKVLLAVTQSQKTSTADKGCG
jgi:hypothetical protein